MKRIGLILAAVLGLAVQAVPASAAIQTFMLACNTLACASPTNYGTVTLTESGSGSGATVNVSVVLTSLYEFTRTNSNVAFQWNGLANIAENVTSVSGGFGSTGNQSPGTFVLTDAANPFTGGTSPGACTSNCFDYALSRSSGNAQTTLTFDVTQSGGLTIANFQTGNDGGLFNFAAKIKLKSDSSLFWVASKVPEPATWALFFAGLTGLTLLYRRRKLAHA